MEVKRLHDEFAAEVKDVDVSSGLSESEFTLVDQAINQYSVLVFRQQSLTDESQIEFTRLFGDLEEEHVSYYSRGEITYIGRVGNIDSSGIRVNSKNRRVNSQTGNEMWHSDSSFREVPSIHSILYAYEVPPEGGDTEFVSARAAYSRLDEKSRTAIDKLVGIHDYIFSRTKVSQDAVNTGQRTYMYPVRQRLVRRNPVTGEKNFYIGSHVREIEGWSDQDSRPLIDRLTREATRPNSIYRHRWQAGDLVMWDNRCVLHRGCGYDADRFRRRMHQTRVRGICPTLAEQI